MNKSAFLKLIQQASNITDQQQSELEQVAATFPYCQTAHLLLAKSAYDKGSMLSTQRLRRASSYATDRQLLKRIIYAVPVLETAPVEAGDAVEEQDVNHLTDEQEFVSEPVIFVEEATAVTEDVTEPEETSITEESLEEVYSPAPTKPEPYPLDSAEAADEEESHEAEIDSELALLFTFSSISSSSTDLLGERDLEEPGTDLPDQETEVTHFAETAEALSDLEQADTEVKNSLTTEADTLPAVEVTPEQEAEEPQVIPEQETALIASDSESEFFAADDDQAPAKPEDAEINYSIDEIDRLYAEDALGYSMGSSRMGEVLQLKDDYTRPRPQSFHPELILEYSKTHELEKAIQPMENVLSKQLDIIDQFLKLNPRLKTMANLKLKPEPQEDLSLKSSKIKKGMASESLAAIFLKQGKTKKALKIYEQLILKYPEKKSYFAEQIEKLQNIT